MEFRTHNVLFQITLLRQITYSRATLSVVLSSAFRFQWDRKASTRIFRFRNRLLHVDISVEEKFECWRYAHGVILSCAGEMATVGGSVTVVTPVRSPLVPSLFVCEVRRFFLPWLLPWASAELSSWEVVLVARRRESDFVIRQITGESKCIAG
jgi:hypothetical protein